MNSQWRLYIYMLSVLHNLWICLPEATFKFPVVKSLYGLT